MQPTTRIGVTVTFLRMDARNPAPLSLPPGYQLARVERCSVAFYRYLYATVGGAYCWWLRRSLGDEALRHPDQLLEASGRRGNLQASDLVEATLAVFLQREQLLDRVPRELTHGLRNVGLEDEARRVRGRSAGHLQRPLVDDGDVFPTPCDQFIGNVGANDAGADDDNARRKIHRVSCTFCANG